MNPDAISDQTLQHMDENALVYHLETGMPVVPFSPQARGFFSGRYVRDQPESGKSDVRNAYGSEENWGRLERACALAREWGATPNQIALAYLMGFSFQCFPIVGARNPQQLADSCGAAAIVLTPRQMVEINSAGDRVLYAAQLYKAGAAPLIILSGGNMSYSQARGTTPAEEMQAFLLGLGIPQEALVLQKQSQNTAEDAFFTKAIFAEKEIRTVILVTSAAHMPRALMMFASPEISLIPAPVDYTVTLRSWEDLMRWDWKTILTHVMPDGSTFGQTTLIMREYLGIFFYRVKFLWDSLDIKLPSLSGLLR